MYSSIITPAGASSTPPGVDEQFKSDSLSVSHKESTASYVKLVYTDTGQMGPANRVYDRLYPDTPPVPPAPSNNATTGKTCPGNPRSAGTDQERSNNRDYCLLDQLRLPDISGREKRRGATSSHQLEDIKPAEHFKMEGLHLLPDLIQQEDWMI